MCGRPLPARHRGRTLRERLNWDVTWRTAQFFVAAVRDVAGAKLGRAPHLVPVVADSGAAAVFTEPEAMAAFEALGGEAVGWRNALAPRMLLALPRYREGTAEQLQMPVLMCGGPRPAGVAQVRGQCRIGDEKR